MRIILASTFVPFVHGGARFIVEWAEDKLREAGHEVERFYLPFSDAPHELLDQVAAFRMMDLAQWSDRLVAFRPPSYVIPHPDKVLWFIHHIRTYYDMWGAEHAPPDTPFNRAVRDQLHALDTTAFNESRAVYTNSRVVSDRLLRFNGVRSEPLYPPIWRPERFRCDGYGDEVLVVCRAEPHKRQHLLVAAMAYVTTPVRLRLCGAASGAAYARRIQDLIDDLDLHDRVAFEDRWIGEDEKADVVAGCLAMAYLPHDEDSYGYPSLEAAHADKAVLTTTDSGGVLELVEDGRNGLVAEPNPRALAAALDRLWTDKAATARMGRENHARLRELRIDWGRVVEALGGPAPREDAGVKVLVVNNAAPFLRGGAEELADHLVRRLDATPGVESELLRLPFSWSPAERLVEEVLIHQAHRLINVDRVIALKFPAYLVPHAHKTLWLLHQFRQAYDLGDAGQGLSDAGREGEIKGAIRRADDIAFGDCRAVYCNSPVTRDRLRRYNGREAQLLYPPLNDAELFTGGEAGGYVFAGGRVAPGKRQHLLVEAMARVRAPGRLLVAGPPESEAYADRLRSAVAEHDLADRVELRFGFHPRADIAAWMNGATACAYLPFDEDSLGYVTMEAFAAGKPVLTTTDSGGLLEMVSAATGAVAEPTPEALAGALDRLLRDPSRTAALGRAAKAEWDGRGLDWPSTVARLLS